MHEWVHGASGSTFVGLWGRYITPSVVIGNHTSPKGQASGHEGPGSCKWYMGRTKPKLTRGADGWSWRGDYSDPKLKGLKGTIILLIQQVALSFWDPFTKTPELSAPAMYNDPLVSFSVCKQMRTKCVGKCMCCFVEPLYYSKSTHWCMYSFYGRPVNKYPYQKIA